MVILAFLFDDLNVLLCIFWCAFADSRNYGITINPLDSAFKLTHADDSRGSRAFIRVCDSVCLSVRTITQKRTISKYSRE